MIMGSNDLYEMAGLDHESWAILGIEVSGFSHGKSPSWDVHVYACDTAENQVAGYEDLKQLERDGGIPVHDIKLHDVPFDEVVKAMKLVGMQFLRRDFTKLTVVELGDNPPQD